MALTYTPRVDHDQTLPQFELPTVENKIWNSQSIRSAPAKVIVFMCNHCPYVKAIEFRLIRLARDLEALGVPFVGICSNDPTEYPEDSPEELLKVWREKKYGFTYLVDEAQTAAKSFGAVCTPDFFVYDKANALAYRGRLDDSWKDPAKVTREELREAVDSILKNTPLGFEQIPAMGCSIKWKSK